MTSTPASTSVSNRKLILHSLLETKDPKFLCRPLVRTHHFLNQKLIDNYNSIYHSGTIIDGFVQCRKCSKIILKRKRDNSNLMKHLTLHEKHIPGNLKRSHHSQSKNPNEGASTGVNDGRLLSILKKLKNTKPVITECCHGGVCGDTNEDSTPDVWYDAVC